MPGVYLFNVPEGVFERGTRPASVSKWKWWYWKRRRIFPISLSGLLSEGEREWVLLGCEGRGPRIKPRLEVDTELARFLGYYAPPRGI